jgi:hypothetical protein
MPYQPSPEKLLALGFTQDPTVTRLWFIRDHPKQYRKIVLRGTESLRVRADGDDEDFKVDLTCPSEAFFDELLVAIGWTARPTALPK